MPVDHSNPNSHPYFESLVAKTGKKMEDLGFDDAQKKRYSEICYSLAQAITADEFAETLIEEFGASSLAEVAQAAIWAIQNNLPFDNMIVGYRQSLKSE